MPSDRPLSRAAQQFRDWILAEAVAERAANGAAARPARAGR
jgi:hypothetical protein